MVSMGIQERKRKFVLIGRSGQGRDICPNSEKDDENLRGT